MDNRKMIYLDDAIDVVSKACVEFRGIFGRCEEGLLALPPAQQEYKPVTAEDFAKSDVRKYALRFYGLV